MRFTLFYDGPLKAATSRSKRNEHKHDIRREFHNQLKLLEDTPYLDTHLYNYRDRNKTDVVFSRGSMTFMPVVNSAFQLAASISVTWLRPGPIGNIFSQSGDIDNRLKTLFDALTMPRSADNIPSFFETDDELFYCVFEDDSLIHSVDISTRQLLKADVGNNDVVLIIDIDTKTVGDVSTFLANP